MGTPDSVTSMSQGALQAEYANLQAQMQQLQLQMAAQQQRQANAGSTQMTPASPSAPSSTTVVHQHVPASPTLPGVGIASGLAPATPGAYPVGMAAPPTPPSPAATSPELALVMAQMEQMQRDAQALEIANQEAMKALLGKLNPTAAPTVTSTHRNDTGGSSRSVVNLTAALDAATQQANKLKASALRSQNAVVQHSLVEQQKEIEFKQKGVDICILMDCTGSMGPYINAVKSKALEIIDLVPAKFPEAIARLAFVGYRDFGDEDHGGRFVVHDFVDKANFNALQLVVDCVQATGGGDAPEDVAGGLEKVLGLSWRCTTRMVIHFGDAPCHGTDYHNLTGDSHPTGNPDGLKPETLLKEFCKKRIDYHFARIGSYTDIMVEKFKKVYEKSHTNCKFEIHNYDHRADDFFLNVMLKSITSSMRDYKKNLASAKSYAGYSTVAGVLPSAYNPQL